MTKLLDYFFRFLAAIATFVVLYLGIGILLKAFLPDLAFSNEIAIGVSLIAAFTVILSRPYLKVAIPLILIAGMAALTPILMKGLDINLQTTSNTSSDQVTKPNTATDAKTDEIKQAVEKPKNTYGQ